MPDLSVHYSLRDAEASDFDPIYGDSDESSLIPCLDVYFDVAIVELVHTGIDQPFIVTPDYVRFDARGPLEIDGVKASLQPGRALYSLIEATCSAAMKDTGLLDACRRVSKCLESFKTDDA